MSHRPTQQSNPSYHAPYPPYPARPQAGGAPPMAAFQAPPAHSYFAQPAAGPLRPPPDPADVLVHRISQLLMSHQAQTDARLNRIDNNVQRLTSEIFSARSESRGCVVQIAEVLQKSHEMQTTRLRRLETILGMGPDMKDSKTLLDRFDLLSFAVEEFLERARDPEANLPDGPLHHDMATSPFRRVYADAGVLPKTPTPKPRVSSVAVGASPDFFSENQSSSTLVADNSILNKQPDAQEANGNLFGDILSRNIPKTTFASVSPVTRSLNPADWDPSPASRQSFSFDPDLSPAGMQAYSALPNPIPSDDGTIASLRQTTLGTHFGPLTSTPCRSTSVHPVSPAPSSRQSLPLSLDTPTLFPSDDEVPQSAAAHDHSATPGEPSQAEDLPTQRLSVGVHALPPFPSTGSEYAAPSRSPTAEPENAAQLQSPSTDTLREELSVLDMMASPSSDAHSNIASPVPTLRGESHPPVPSSVSPSPLQCQNTSPPALRLIIPGREPTPTPAQRSETSPTPFGSPSIPPGQGVTGFSALNLFDPFMSPLSPSTASLAPESPPSASPPASSVQESIDVPVPLPEPQPSLIRALPGKKRKAKAQEPDATASEGPPSKRARQRANKIQGTAIGASGSGKQGKGRKKNKKLKEEGETVLWPAMTPVEEVVPEFVGKFIGCDNDNCQRWYHYTCLGVVPGDPRLESTFLCPLCVA
ncbi:hypothetical protein B0H12DRAFT_141089 [Mycena haematopus]|nr:hypothetical protein B0H12DRAFT_141089 [Mycena haematopus]